MNQINLLEVIRMEMMITALHEELREDGVILLLIADGGFLCWILICQIEDLSSSSVVRL